MLHTGIPRQTSGSILYGEYGLDRLFSLSHMFSLYCSSPCIHPLTQPLTRLTLSSPRPSLSVIPHHIPHTYTCLRSVFLVVCSLLMDISFGSLNFLLSRVMLGIFPFCSMIARSSFLILTHPVIYSSPISHSQLLLPRSAPRTLCMDWLLASSIYI